MEVKELVPYLKEKFKRDVTIVPAKKDEGVGGGGDKKDKDGGGDKKDKPAGDKKDKDAGGGDKKDKGGDKKEDKKDEKKEKGSDGDKKKESEQAAKVEVNKFEHHGYDPYRTYFLPSYDHNYSSGNYEYGSTSSVPMYNQSYSNQDYGIMTTSYDQGYVNHGYHHVMEGGYSHAPTQPYYHGSANAPQMFSDENPNACSIM